MCNTDDVNGTNGTSLGGDIVEEGHHFLFVGDGDIQPTKVRIGTNDLCKGIDGGNLVVLVNGVNAFVLELLVEVANGEGMSEGIAYKSIFVHNCKIIWLINTSYIFQK